jgi:hypothetical protein
VSQIYPLPLESTQSQKFCYSNTRQTDTLQIQMLKSNSLYVRIRLYLEVGF